MAVLYNRDMLASEGGRAKFDEAIEVAFLQFLFDRPSLGADWPDIDAALHKAFQWLEYSADNERNDSGALTEVAVFATQAMSNLVQGGKLHWRERDDGPGVWLYLTTRQWLMMTRLKSASLFISTSIPAKQPGQSCVT